LDLLAIFDRNFAKIMAPPSDGNENYVVRLKELSILKKVLKTSSKSTHKPSHNTCLNNVPTCRQTKRDIQRKTPIFAPTTGAPGSISPKLCMLIENVMTILKGVNHFFDPTHSFSCRGENTDFWPLTH